MSLNIQGQNPGPKTSCKNQYQKSDTVNIPGGGGNLVFNLYACHSHNSVSELNHLSDLSDGRI